MLFDSKNASKATFSLPEAGILENLTVCDISVTGEGADRLRVTFKKENGQEMSQLFFGVNTAYADTEQKMQRDANRCVRRVMEIITLFYDKEPEIMAETWQDFLRKCVMKYKEGNKKQKVRAVWTYNRNGYLSLRSSLTQPNVEKMVEGVETSLVLNPDDILLRPLREDREKSQGMSAKDYFNERTKNTTFIDAGQEVSGSSDLPF